MTGNMMTDTPMTDTFTEDDAIAAIAGLTRPRLVAFIAARVVIPLQSAAGPVFRPIDIARLRLLCELSEDLDLDDAALAVVMGLIDQLHEARFALRSIALVIAEAPPELRMALAARWPARETPFPP